MEYPKNIILKTFDESKMTSIIVDIDGCLAFHDDKRTPYEYDKIEWDRCNPYLKELLPMFKNLSPSDIIIVTGRSEIARRATEKWLKINWIIYDFLFMRKNWDKIEDTEFKWEIYETIIAPNYNVLAVFEDTQRLVDMYRLKYNLPTYQVWYSPK